MKVYPNSLLRKMDAQTESLSAAGTGLGNVGNRILRDAIIEDGKQQVALENQKSMDGSMCKP